MSVRRIVSCTPSSTEILLLLGLGDSIVGMDERSAELPSAPFVGSVGVFDNIDISQVAALKPDIIIVTETVPGAEAMIDAMREEKLPLLILTSERFDDLLGDTYTIGVACGVEEKARQVVERLHMQVNRITAMVRTVDAPMRAYFEWWPNPFLTSGSQSWVNDLLKKAGVINIFADIPNSTFLVDEEEIIGRDPEIIFICWIGAGDSDAEGMDKKTILSRKGWETTGAVRNKRVVFLPDTLFLFPGPNLLEGLMYMIESVAEVMEA